MANDCPDVSPLCRWQAYYRRQHLSSHLSVTVQSCCILTHLSLRESRAKRPPDLSWKDHRLQKTAGIDVYPGPSASLKDSPMYILRALVFLFLTQAVFAQQPTPILPDPKLTPGDTFDVTAQDVCVPGYAKKVRAVPAWLKRQA